MKRLKIIVIIVALCFITCGCNNVVSKVAPEETLTVNPDFYQQMEHKELQFDNNSSSVKSDKTVGNIKFKWTKKVAVDNVVEDETVEEQSGNDI